MNSLKSDLKHTKSCSICSGSLGSIMIKHTGNYKAFFTMRPYSIMQAFNFVETHLDSVNLEIVYLPVTACHCALNILRSKV